MNKMWVVAVVLSSFACGKTISAKDSGGHSSGGDSTSGHSPILTVAITSPTNGTVVTAPLVQIGGSATGSEAITSLRYQLNQHAAIPVTIASANSVAFGFSVSGLSSGANSIVVFATTKSATGQSAPLTVTFSASSTAFEAPSAANLNVAAVTENPTAITLAGSGGNGAPLQYVVSANPAHGTLSGLAPTLSYRSAAGFTGTDTFTYTVSDGTTTTAPATITVTVSDGTILYVDGGNGSDSNSGRAPDRAKLKIQSAIDAASGTYVTVDVAAGVYPEYLGLNKTLAIVGPAVSGDIVQGSHEPQVAVQPPAGQLADYVAIINIGDASDAGATAPVVTLNNLKIDGSLIGPSIVPNGSTRFIGVSVHPGASAKLDHDFFWYERLQDSELGDQVGLGLYSLRGDIEVENSLFAETGKQQLTLHASDVVTTAPNHAKLHNCHFVGTDPTAVGTQNSEDGVILWNNVVAEVTGNLFEGFGDSGPNKADMGQARVAHDYSTGVGLGFAFTSASAVSPTNVNTVTGNTFRQCQAYFEDDSAYPGSPAPAPIHAPAFLAANTIQGGYFIPGDLGTAFEVFGARTSDPNFINYVIAWDAGWPTLDAFWDYGCDKGTATCQVVISPGTYCMTSPLFNLSTVTPTPPATMTLVAASGTVDLYTPDIAPPAGSLPAGYVAGTGVTIHLAQPCPL